MKVGSRSARVAGTSAGPKGGGVAPAAPGSGLAKAEGRAHLPSSPLYKVGAFAVTCLACGKELAPNPMGMHSHGRWHAKQPNSRVRKVLVGRSARWVLV